MNVTFDAYFDFLPGGYTDDLAMMAALLVESADYATLEVEERIGDYLPEDRMDADTIFCDCVMFLPL